MLEEGGKKTPELQHWTHLKSYQYSEALELTQQLLNLQQMRLCILKWS